MIQETSKDSLQELSNSGELGLCEAQVYLYIKHYPESSLKDIAEGTGLLQENVCGRKKSLEEKGWIIKAGEKYNPTTNRRVETWKISEGEPKLVTPKLLKSRQMERVRDLIIKANKHQRNMIIGWCETWNKQKS